MSMEHYKYTLKWEDHDWEKLNLVTKTCSDGAYDEYGCKCGAWAHRYGIGGPLLSSQNFKPCKEKTTENTVDENDPTKGYRVGVKATFTDPYIVSSFGFERGVIYESCVGTDDRFKSDLWFMSPRRKEPVRLFMHEYKLA